MIYKYVAAFGLEQNDHLNELDVALMSIPELVTWVGANVGWFDAYFLADDLEKIKPGVRAAYVAKYGPPKGMEEQARDAYRTTHWEVSSHERP